MAAFEEGISITLPFDQTMLVCRAVIAEMGWNMEDEGPDYLRPIQELGATAALFRPVRLEITLQETDGVTRVTVRGRKSGWNDGTRRVPLHAATFRNRLVVAAERAVLERTREEPAGLAVELERLAELHERGTLTHDEFQAAKSKLLGL